ncbi:MAG: hypothetical protein IT350_08950 [Deltaproteobacteria bacterium]|nr:hypothetical protein [Deltaproteobacteria bacterium]
MSVTSLDPDPTFRSEIFRASRRPNVSVNGDGVRRSASGRFSKLIVATGLVFATAVSADFGTFPCAANEVTARESSTADVPNEAGSSFSGLLASIASDTPVIASDSLRGLARQVAERQGTLTQDEINASISRIALSESHLKD